MLRTKTPWSRDGKARSRASTAASAVKAKPKAVAAEGSSPSGELSMQLEHVSLVSFLSDRCPGVGLTRFEALLEEEDVSLSDPPPLSPLLPQPQQPPPPPMQEAAPMDADEPMEEKDICILSQDLFCTPDYITPEMPQVANEFDDDKENIPCPKSPEKSANPRSKR